MTVFTATYRFRIKNGLGALRRAARSVNEVWNFCNQSQIHALRHKLRWPNLEKFQELTKGSSKLLRVPAQCIQSVYNQYWQSRSQHKKNKLRFRSRKALGWIPATNQAVWTKGDKVWFNGKWHRFWKHRELPQNSKVLSASFSEDARGRWYFNCILEIRDSTGTLSQTCKVGIDLGLKATATLSDSTVITNNRYYVKSEARLTMLQRAHKLKQTRALHAKIRNQRKDFQHKVSHNLVSTYSHIFVGDLPVEGLMKTNLAKSFSDAAWSSLRSMIRYKAVRHGVVYKEVSERYSTQTCSHCLLVSGPKGIAGLGIREWTCSYCHTTHDRDVNAAKNILRLGRQTLEEGDSTFG